MNPGSHLTSAQSVQGDEESVVYVVDDEQSMRFALSNLFRSVGLPVETFESSGDFLVPKIRRAKLPGSRRAVARRKWSRFARACS